MKKNILKIPQSILNKTDELNNKIITFGYVKATKEDILQNKYSHLNIKFENNKIEYPDQILPNPKQGRYSKYNVIGKLSAPLKELPKIKKTYSFDAPNFGDISKGYHTITITREVYQKKFCAPKFINLIFELQESESPDLFIFKVYTDYELNTTSTTFNDDLLFNCNLLQENIYNFDVTDTINSELYAENLYVNWDLLPPGESSIDLLKNIFSTKQANPKKTNTIETRLNVFKELGVKKYIRGTNSFNSYIGALFNNDIVLLENPNYGNATYIIKSDWETLSKLSRTELLSNYSDSIIRILHNKNWKSNLKTNLDSLTK